MPDYNKEQLWKLYQKLPEELREALFSPEITETVYNICTRNGIKEDEKIYGVIKYMGNVLLGILPPENFLKALEEEVKLESKTATKIAQEINLLVFYPLKESLLRLYEKKVVPPGPFEITPPEPIEEKEKPEILEEKEKMFEEKPKPKPKRVDIYREPIE